MASRWNEREQGSKRRKFNQPAKKTQPAASNPNKNTKSTDTRRNSGRTVAAKPAPKAAPKAAPKQTKPKTVYYSNKNKGSKGVAAGVKAAASAATRSATNKVGAKYPQTQALRTLSRQAGARNYVTGRDIPLAMNGSKKTFGQTVTPLEQMKADAVAGPKYWGSRTSIPSKKLTAEQQKKKNQQTAKQSGFNARARRQTVSKWDRNLPDGPKTQIERAKQRFDEAKARGDMDEAWKAHREAENIRIAHGYSGGITGNEHITAKLSQDDYNRLNKAGEEALGRRKLQYESAKAMGDRDRMDRAHQAANVIRRARGYQDNRLSSAETGKGWSYGPDGRRMWNGTKEQNRADAAQGAAGFRAVGEGIAGGLLYAGQTASRATRDKFERENIDKWIADEANYNQAKSRLEFILDYKRQFGVVPDGYNEMQAQIDYNNAVQARAQLQRIRGDVDSLYFDPTVAERLGLPTTRDETLGERLLRQAAEDQAKATEGMNGVERFVTNALISTGQSVPGMALGLIPGVGPALGLGVLGAQAGGSRAYDLRQQGVTAEDAYRAGFISGGIEALTEKLPLENFAQIVKGKGGKSALRNVLEQAGLEGSEEAVSYVGNYIADVAQQNPDAHFSWLELLENAGMGAIGGAAFGVAGGILSPGHAVSPAGAQSEEIQEHARGAATQIEAVQDAETQIRTAAAQRLREDAQAYNEMVKAGVWSDAEKEMVKASLDQRYAEIAGQNAGQTSPVANQAPLTQVFEDGMQRNWAREERAHAASVPTPLAVNETPASVNPVEQAKQMTAEALRATDAEMARRDAVAQLQAETPPIIYERSGLPPTSFLGAAIDARREARARAEAEAQVRRDQEIARQNRVTAEQQTTTTNEPAEISTTIRRNEQAQVQQPVSRLDGLASTFGESGAASLRTIGGKMVTGQGAFVRDFTDVYNQVLGGRSESQVSRPAGMSDANYFAAVTAAQNDRQTGWDMDILKASKAAGRNVNAGIDWRDQYVRQMDRKTARTVDGLAKALGVKVVFAEKGSILTAGGERANGEITGNVVRIEKDNPNPVRMLIGHELTHRMQDVSPESYRAFRDYAMSVPGSMEALERTVSLYQRAGAFRAQDNARQMAMDEVTADYAGALLENSEQLQEFIRRNYENRTLLETIRDFFRSIRDALTGRERAQADEAVRLLEEAISGASKQLKQSDRRNRQNVNRRRLSLGGINAQTANVQRLSEAKKMERKSKTEEEIRQATGWLKGPDGKWRFEISDVDASFDFDANARRKQDIEEARDLWPKFYERFESQDRPDAVWDAYYEIHDMIQKAESQTDAWFKMDRIIRDLKAKGYETDDLRNLADAELDKETNPYADTELKERTLADYLDHPALFQAYPELRDTMLRFADLGKGINGQYNPQDNEILLNKKLTTEDEVMDTLSHEVQHAIQHIEGFASGASPEYWETRRNAGWPIRTKGEQKKLRELREKLADEYDENKALVDDVMRLNRITPTVPRGEVDWDTLEQIEEDPPEWQEFDRQREALEAKYGDMKVFDLMELVSEIERLEKGAARTPRELYWMTAGEVEAREVADRRELSEDERRKTPPRLGGDDVVFAKGARYSITPQADADYMAAVESGDMETAQRMVDEAAKAAGYTIKAYHGSAKRHNVFDTQRGAGTTQYGPGTYFTDAKGLAEDWALERALDDEDGYVGEYYINDADYFDDRSVDTGTPQWRQLEDILYLYGVTEKKIKVARANGFSGIAVALQSIGMLDNSKYGAFDWKNTTKVNDVLREAGYKGIVGDFYDSTQWVVFDSSEVKSADPVTYDDDGDVIPLSERFNAETGDIRYSIGTEGYDRARLMRENQELKEKLEYWRGQVKKSDRTKADPKEVRKLAKSLRTDYSTDMDAGEITQRLQAIYDGIGKDWSYDRAYEEAGKLARDMIEQATETEDYLYAEYEPMRKFFQDTPLVVTKEMQRAIPDYNEWRKPLFGKLRLKGGDKTNVDQVFQEAVERWPEFFNEEVSSHSLDQLDRIVEVLDNVYQREEVNPFGDDIAGPAGYLTTQIMDSFWDVPSIKKTFADRAEARLGREVTRRLDMKERYENALQKVREQRDRKLKEQSERYLTAKKKRSQQQTERELRAKIQRHVRDMQARLDRPNDKKNVPKNLRDPVIAMLESINLSSGFTVVQLPNGKTKRVKDGSGENTKRTEAFIALRDQLKAMHAEGQPIVLDKSLFGDSEENIQGWFDTVIQMQDTPIANMNLEQLDIVWKTVRAVEHAITTFNRTLASEKYNQTDNWANALWTDSEGRRQMKGTGILLDMETPYTFFSQFGESGLAIYRMFRDAQDLEKRREIDIRDKLKEIVTQKQVKAWSEHRHTFDVSWEEATEDGMETRTASLTLTDSQIMDLYLLSKRPQGQGHLLKGGIVQPEIRTGRHKIERGTESIPLTAEKIGEITAKLSQEQVEAAKKIQKLTSYMAQWGNEASLKAFGYEKFTEPNYWMIRTAKEGIHSSVENNRNNPRSVQNLGLAKSTIPNASNAVDLTGIFENFGRHADEMNLYATWLCPMMDANRLYNWTFRDAEGHPTNRTIKGMMNRVAGQKATNYWDNLMKDIQNGLKNESDTTIIRYVNKVIGNAKGAAVGANARVIIQQPTAFFRALSVMNPADLAAGTVAAPTKGSGWKKAKQWAGIALRKSDGGFDIAGASGVMGRYFDQQTRLEQIRDTAGKPAGLADAFTWGKLWNAAEWQVARQEKDLEKGSDAYYRRTAEVFTEMIDQTQVVDGVLQRSQIMRSGNDILKQATAFKGEPLMSANMLIRGVLNYRNETNPKKRTAARKALGRSVAAFTVTAVVNALAQAVMDGIRDDDKDRKYREKFFAAFLGTDMEGAKALAASFMDAVKNDEPDTTFAKRLAEAYAERMDDENAKWGEDLREALLTGNLMENLNVLGGIPFASDLFSMMQGYDVTRADADVVADVIKAWQSVFDDKQTKWYSAARLATQAGRMLGIPGQTLIRDATALTRSFAQWRGNVPMMYEIEKAIYNTGSSKNRKLFESIAWAALKDGDLDTFNHIREDLMESGITDGKKLDNAMKKLAEANPDVELSQHIRDLIGVHPTFATDEEEEEAKFGADSLDGAQYAAYSEERANTYRPLEDRLINTDAFANMDDEAKDKALKTLWDYADKTALEAHSNGQYVADSTTIKGIREAESVGISPADYLIIKTAADAAQGTTDADGNTITNSLGIAKMEALDNSGIQLTAEQRTFMLDKIGVGKAVASFNADNLAKEKEKIQAKAEAPSTLSILGEGNEGTVQQYTEFLETVVADYDSNGKQIKGKGKQDKIIQYIKDIPGLSREQRSALYHMEYESDKNNPWA